MLTLLLSCLKRGGKALIFHSSVLKDSKEEVPIVRALQYLEKETKKSEFIFRVHDFTKQEEAFLERTEKLLEEFKFSFEEEGLKNLYLTKKKESEKGLFWHRKNLSHRIFTVIEKVRS